ncbi:hypothetical protein X777_03200 [Ooceraea biroi]|uniref:Uncharacterized protein n=1 Tax=Ooceraea biroi TaxID=2015173 RepID=A0A026WL82_OOCBI|nr:hypothetical protein X777_03200 [Ooceraea biroi]
MSNIPIIFLRSANSTPAVTSKARDTAASQSQRRRRCVRILGRRYALTTEHKYLEVGINVEYGPSYMEIAVGDKRGNELTLGMETWKGLVEHQRLIQEYFSKTDKRPVDPIYIGPLTVEFIKFKIRSVFGSGFDSKRERERERAAATTVWTAMEAKTKLSMGMKTKKKMKDDKNAYGYNHQYTIGKLG